MAASTSNFTGIPEGSCKKFELKSGSKSEEAFVVRSNGQCFAYKNICPHISLPLDWGNDNFLTTNGKYIICRNHGALFLPETGECVDGPCAGEFLESVAIEKMGTGT